MDLYPAIDLRAGRCVRLYQGDYGCETAYGVDPVTVARTFAAAGAHWLHVVDLDAARTGTPENRDVVAAITGAVSPGVAVQVGGGVRDQVWATQFHPEKSGASGLRLLTNFVEVVRASRSPRVG